MNQSQIILELANNTSMLLAVAVFSDLILSRGAVDSSLTKRVLLGVVVGTTTIMLMLTAVVVPPGFLFDTRSVVLSLSGLFFGLLPTAIAVILAGAFRIYVGGVGVFLGLELIVGSAVVGLVWRAWRKPVLDKISWAELFYFSSTVHFLSGIAILLHLVERTILSIIIPFILYVVGTVLLGRMLVNRIRRRNDELELKASEERHRLLFENARDAMLLLSSPSWRVSASNRAAERLFGASEEVPLNGCLCVDLVEFGSEYPEVTQSSVVKLIEQTLAGEPQRCRLMQRRLDKGSFPSEMELNRLELPNETVVHVVIRDLSAEKAAADALIKSELMYRTLIETSIDGVWWISPEGRILGVNNAYCEMSGYSREELLTMGAADIECIESDDVIRKHFQKIVIEGRQRFVSRHRRKDGTTYPIEISLQYIPSEGGMIFAFLRDITERKRMEEALERRLVALTRPLKEGNPVSFEDLFDLDTIQRIQDEFAAATGVAAIITQVDGTPITRPSRFCRLCSEIIRGTEKGRKHCYESDSVLGSYRQGGVSVRQCLSGGLMDAGASIMVGGRHIANWLIGQVRCGMQLEDNLRRYAKEIGADEEEAVAAFREVPEMSIEQFQNVARVLQTLANQLSLQAYQNIQQARFIADRRQAEHALIQSEHEFRLVWEEAQDGMRLTDGVGNVRRVNEAYCRMVGKPRSELEGHSLAVAYGEDEKKLVLDSYIKKYRLGIISPRMETRVVLWDGRELDLELSNSCLSVSDGAYLVLSIIRDITQRKKSEHERQQLESQLIQSRKMEAVGRLAGGVAHDFNNLLAAMMLHLSLLEERSNLDEEVRSAIKELHSEAERAANLTRQLLMFSRRAVLQVRVVDLNEVVENLLKMLRRLIGEQVSVIFRPHVGNLQVNIDVGMIEQVILNLAVNARDAMPEGGTVVISTGFQEFESVKVDMLGKRRPGKYALLSVADSGCGIPPEVMAVIFEPFFSTKGPGQGTGLGLSTVEGIVTQHKGWIEVDTAVGKGSDFRVYLPSVLEGGLREAQTLEAAVSPPQKSAGGMEKILLVEDEVSVRSITKRSLERKGYRVTEATDARDALEKWDAYHGNFDLLLTDMVMPEGGNGLNLARQLVAKKPLLRVIIASGYSEDLARMGETQPPNMAFLPKPFDIDTLNATIRRCLDDR